MTGQIVEPAEWCHGSRAQTVPGCKCSPRDPGRSQELGCLACRFAPAIRRLRDAPPNAGEMSWRQGLPGMREGISGFMKPALGTLPLSEPRNSQKDPLQANPSPRNGIPDLLGGIRHKQSHPTLGSGSAAPGASTLDSPGQSEYHCPFGNNVGVIVARLALGIRRDFGGMGTAGGIRSSGAAAEDPIYIDTFRCLLIFSVLICGHSL